jgi:hypothetical protein
MATDKFPHYSGMDFIPDNAYVIENSPIRLHCGDGIRSVEFIRRKNSSLLFIEAKTTIANPTNSPEPFKIEVDEICEKFIHSLNLLSAVKLGVIEELLLDSFIELRKISLKFILVVCDHKPEWCRPIKRTIEKELPTYLRKIWKPTIYVINHATAKKYQLVS